MRDFAPGIEVELRYATTDNFTGQIVDGYESTGAAILRTEAAEALAAVQREVANAALAQGNVLSVVSIVLGMLLIGGFSLALNRSISGGLGRMEQAVAPVVCLLEVSSVV